MMTENEWLDYAKQNRTKLESLIRDWHPRSPRMGHDMKITAPRTELACAVVRKQIRSLDNNKKPDPVKYFNEALDRDDWPIVNVVLNEAWFGVPESISCWNIEGFTEAVRLMEDIPESEVLEDRETR